MLSTGIWEVTLDVKHFYILLLRTRFYVFKYVTYL